MNNREAFLATIAYSEGTNKIGSINGYNVLVGSTPNKMIRIDDLDKHPRITVQLSKTLWSSAAGRYQIIWPTWNVLSMRLGLKDFSPDSQDRAAIELIRECGALQMVDKGEIADAIKACSKIWASFPEAGYGQRENKLEDLLAFYQKSGGHLA